MNRIILKCCCWEAVIAPEIGAHLISLTYQGRNILRPLNIDEPLPESVTRWGAPLLFPANRTEKAEFEFEGLTYHLPVNNPRGECLHGILRNQTFTVVKTAENYAELCYENTGEIYPFPFVFTVCYTLSECGIKAVYRIHNTGKTAMPYVFGLHTSFPEPQRCQVEVGLPQLRDETGLPHGQYAGQGELEKKIAAGFHPDGKNFVTFCSAAGKNAWLDDTHMEVEGFDHWTVFYPGNEGVLCAEPQTGGVNGLNYEGGHAVLAAGAVREHSMKISLQ